MRASFLTLALLGACSDYGLGVPDSQNEGGDPVIDVQPRALDFLSVGPDETEVRTFTITNVGETFLELEPLELIAESSFSLLDADTPEGLMPGEWIEVDVAFSPMQSDAVEGSVMVRSNDSDTPEIPVSLIGRGLIPLLQILPATHDFGDIEVSCAQDLDLVLQNIGAADLDLQALALDGEGFTLVSAPALPLVLEPGEYTTATVEFLPIAEGSYTATLTARSNDPRGDQLATQVGVGVGGEVLTEVFAVEVDAPVDILFVVDRSGSMDDDGRSLSQNFEAFIAGLATVTTGWQIGVATQDSGCINGGVLTATTPGLLGLFEEAVSSGQDPDIVNDEALLRMADLTLAETGAGGCSEGLLRADSPLHVIVVSDEPERSNEQAAAWTWDFWVDALGARLSDPSLLTISGIVDRDGCNEGDDGYAEAIAATGGAHLSLCDADWADDVATLADLSTAFAWSYALAEEPLEESLSVTVDGSPATGWSWDPHTGSVIFDEQPAGEEVTVQYQVAGTCP